MRPLALVTILPILATALAVGVVAHADGPRSALVSVVDPRDGVSLTIETEPAMSNAGHFVFRVPGLGHYVGEAAAGMRSLSPTSVLVKWSGSATLRPEVAADGTIGGSVTTPVVAEIELHAQLDPLHGTAEADLRDGPRRYHLVVSASGPGGLLRTMRAVEEAFVADDPAALYQFANGDLRAAYGQQEFMNLWRAQSADIGRVTSMKRTALGEPETNELGFVFVTAAYEVERVKPTGGTEARAFDLLFVREGSDWKLLFSRPR